MRRVPFHPPREQTGKRRWRSVPHKEWGEIPTLLNQQQRNFQSSITISVHLLRPLTFLEWDSELTKVIKLHSKDAQVRATGKAKGKPKAEAQPKTGRTAKSSATGRQTCKFLPHALLLPVVSQFCRVLIFDPDPTSGRRSGALRNTAQQLLGREEQRALRGKQNKAMAKVCVYHAYTTIYTIHMIYLSIYCINWVSRLYLGRRVQCENTVVCLCLSVYHAQLSVSLLRLWCMHLQRRYRTVNANYGGHRIQVF